MGELIVLLGKCAFLSPCDFRQVTLGSLSLFLYVLDRTVIGGSLPGLMRLYHGAWNTINGGIIRWDTGVGT